MDITKLTDSSNVLALLSGEKGLYDFSKKDQKEVISIINESPQLMTKYLSLQLDDEIDLGLYSSNELEKFLSPKLKASLEVLDYAISIKPTWLNAFDDSIISDKHILASLPWHDDIADNDDFNRVLEAMRSTHLSDKFIFEIIKVDSLNPMNVICSTIANLDLSKTEITDKAIIALLGELRRNVEQHTERGKDSIFSGYSEYGEFFHWTERMGGVDDFNEFVKAITARNSKKITSELILLKNCFEEYFKMLKKENIENHVEEPIQAWIDVFEH